MLDADGAAPPPAKKKRNLPGTPDPSSEVVALSPETLLATHRFVCEVCGKGFQRDQNLQLHRRGHNLPWRLRQRPPGDGEGGPPAPPRRRVYVCPEPSCVHHDPSRALGDLTGIKKHFSRKHGEKKWRCDRCGRCYAVAADLKAHGKICGTKDYLCSCGSQFTRKDSFMTHRSFCRVVAEEAARQANAAAAEDAADGAPAMAELQELRLLGGEEDGESMPAKAKVQAPWWSSLQDTAPRPPQPAAACEEEEPKDSTSLLVQDENEGLSLQCRSRQPVSVDGIAADTSDNVTATAADGYSSCSTGAAKPAATSLFSGLVTSVAPNKALPNLLDGNKGHPDRPFFVEPSFLCLATGAPPALLFSQPIANDKGCIAYPSTPHMSATALLQKAAEICPATPPSSSHPKEFVPCSASSAPMHGRSADGDDRVNLELGTRFSGDEGAESCASTAKSLHYNQESFENDRLRQWRSMINDRRMNLQGRPLLPVTAASAVAAARATSSASQAQFNDWSQRHWFRVSNGRGDLTVIPAQPAGLDLALSTERSPPDLPELIGHPVLLSRTKPTFDFLGLGTKAAADGECNPRRDG